MSRFVTQTIFALGAATLINCGGADDPGAVDDTIDTTAAELSTCVDACNPGEFNGQRWTCRANLYLPTGHSCASGWERCVPGCNPGHFLGTLWSCDSNPNAQTGGGCASGWAYCDPDNCQGSLGIKVVDWDNDGCSGPGEARDKERFHDACVFHDQCYGTPGRSKSACDSEFRSRMRNRCTFYDLPCFAAAEAFYTAVALAGGDAYSTAQDAVRGATIILDHGVSYYP